MKKKLFESIGGNMFKLKTNEDAFGSDGPSGHDHHRNSDVTSTLEDAIEAMTPVQRNDNAEIFKAIDAFFKASRKEMDTSIAISIARNALKNNNIDTGLVDEYLENEAGASNNPNDDEMNENSNVESDIEAQKAMYRNFEIDYSKGVTFSNNLLALYGVGKRGPVWLTSFEDGGGEPMSKEEIIATLNKVGLGKLSSQIPSDYESGEGFKGTHA
jgi:hypothetical protein